MDPGHGSPLDHAGGEMGGGGGGMTHGGMDMGPGACKMNMIWSWSVPTDGTCVVFSSWQINSNRSFVSSMLFIIFLGAMYEWLRLKIRTMDASLAAEVVHSPHRRRASVLPTTNLYSDPSASASSSSASDVSVNMGDGNEVRGLLSRKGKGRSKGELKAGSKVAIVPPLPVSRNTQVRRSLLYGVSVFLSFFLMLIFMTYNVYLIGATVVGAILGHYLFNRDLAAQSKIGALADRGAVCH